MVMMLSAEIETQVDEEERTGMVLIGQRRGDSTDFVFVEFGPARARLVAAEMIRLADKIDYEAAAAEQENLEN
jgi:hypothetical protein